MRYWFSILLFISIQVSANNSEQKEWWEYIDGSVKLNFDSKKFSIISSLLKVSGHHKEVNQVMQDQLS